MSERLWATGLTALEGTALGCAAYVIPWTLYSWFSVLSAVCSGAALAAAGALVVGSPHAARVWRLSAWLSLSWTVGLTLFWLRAAAFLSSSYGALGSGFALAMLCVWAAVILFALPVSVWGLARTGGVALRLGAGLSLGVLLVIGIGVSSAQRAVQSRLSVAPLGADALQVLAPPSSAASTKVLGLGALSAARCEKAPVAAPTTLLVAFGAARDPRHICFQGERDEVLKRAQQRLLREGNTGPILVEWVVDARSLRAAPDWLRAALVQPGVEGLCHGARCIGPSPLLAQGAFDEGQPLAFLPDLRFGVHLDRWRRRLGGEEAELVAITTQSAILDAGGVRPLRRLRAAPKPIALKERVSRARAWAESYLLGAQQEGGWFRYRAEPFRERNFRPSLNLPRQAGTTLALCELGEVNDLVNSAIGRTLASLVEKEVQVPMTDGALGALTRSKGSRFFRLSDSALALAALLRCHERVGTRFDAAIGRLLRLHLHLQRDNGAFAPSLVRGAGGVLISEGPEPLYLSGQALLVLLLAIERYDALEPQPSVALAELHERAQRTMDYVASGGTWTSSLRPFFFLEENWHCIAARLALRVHPHPEHARFCLDYVAFKSRLILSADSAEQQFVGGFGFGNLVPPHTVATAGFGEALAAAIVVGASQGEDVRPLRKTLSRMLAYLAGQQWTPEQRYWVRPEALGGFSSSPHSNLIRIDNVQHAYAAFGHGQQALWSSAAESVL